MGELYFPAKAKSFQSFLNSSIIFKKFLCFVKSTILGKSIFGGFDGEGNINEDPLFCDSENNNFTLAENSPCVGSGFEGENMGVFDIGCESIEPEITEFWVFTISIKILQVSSLI